MINNIAGFIKLGGQTEQDLVATMPSTQCTEQANRSESGKRAALGLLLRLSVAASPLKQRALLDDRWKVVGCAAVLAARHANQRNGTIVAEMANLDPGLRIELSIMDTESSAAGAVVAYRHMVECDGVAGIVGPPLSQESIPLGLLSGIDRIPLISYYAASNQLSDAVRFPFFARTQAASAQVKQPRAHHMLQAAHSSDLNRHARR